MVLSLDRFRSPETGTAAEAGRPLVLVSDVLPEINAGYVAEIVDARGRRIFSAQPELREGKLAVRFPGLRSEDHLGDRRGSLKTGIRSAIKHHRKHQKTASRRASKERN